MDSYMVRTLGISAAKPDRSALADLADYIRARGPIKTARVSSAQARGAAKRYSYWGAVRYQIRLGADGAPTNVALERASSDRRSYRLADQDCDALCDREHRISMDRIGRLSECHAVAILSDLATRYRAMLPLARYAAR